MTAPVAIGIGLLLLVGNGFFVAAEFALLASRRSRLEQIAAEGDKRAGTALAGLRELSLMLAGAQLGITMCSLGLGMVGEPAVATLFEGLFDLVGLELSAGLGHAISFGLALAIVVFLHMVVGEMAPKSWAISHPEASALKLIRLFRGFTLLFRPLISVLNGLANAVIRLVGVEPQDERAMAHSPADLQGLLRESVGHGIIPADQQLLLTRTLELSGLDALSAMTPRRRVVSADADATPEELEEIARTSGRSRIVVMDGDLDRVLGALHIKDLLVLGPEDRALATARSLSHPVLVTPENRRLENLLVDMREQRLLLAVVIDEMGTVAGIVTMEDVLEELIGDFDDESDRDTERFRRLSATSFAVSGLLRPSELAERTGVHLPDGEWDTVAGYLLHRLERVPSAGDHVLVDHARLEVTVMEGYAVSEVQVDLTVDPEALARAEAEAET